MRCRRAHEEIGEALAEFVGALRAGACHTLGTRFARFWVLLDDHMEWEEHSLLPALERRTPGFTDGPGRALRAGHDAIRRFAAVVARQLQCQPLAVDGLRQIMDAVTRMEEALRNHDREEAILLLRNASDPRES